LFSNGDYAAASGLLERAIGHFPYNPEIGVHFFRMAIEREDYRESLRRMESILKAYPTLVANDEGVRNMLAHAHLCVRMDEIQAKNKTNFNSEILVAAGTQGRSIEVQTLMKSFESLGGNCEFGLIQRHFGVEPLGLLRWTQTSPSSLTQALNADFLGVGQPEQTVLIPTGKDYQPGEEYMTTDKLYGMGMHTFIKVNPAKEQEIWQRLTQRLQFLREKMLEDLRHGTKTFIYHYEHETSAQEIADLHQAICRHGSRFFLYVEKAGENRPVGTVQDAGGGLMLGYIDRLGPDRRPEGHIWNPSHEIWLSLCQQAARIKASYEPDTIVA
jgi:hypothetical protein